MAKADAPLGQAAHEDPERDPGGGQGRVGAPMPPPGGAKAAGDERAVVEERQQRSGHDHFLGADAGQAGQDGKGEPEPAAARRDRRRAAGEAVERQQVAQAHQRLGALGQVGHRFGLHRVPRPERAHQESQDRRVGAEARREQRPPQRAPHQGEQDPSGQDVNAEVDRMIAEYLGASDRVVDRVGKVEQRPTADHVGRPGREGEPGRPQAPNGRVARDREMIVQ